MAPAKVEGKKWLRQAEDDLKALIDLINTKHWAQACFMAQQTAELALKAFLYYKGEEPIRSHLLFELCNMATEYDEDFHSLIGKIKELDFFYTTTRYPNGHLEDMTPAEYFTRSDAEKSHRIADKLMQIVRKKII